MAALGPAMRIATAADNLRLSMLDSLSASLRKPRFYSPVLHHSSALYSVVSPEEVHHLDLVLKLVNSVSFTSFCLL